MPRIRALLLPLLSTVAMIPPLAMLPILFIILGLEEAAKITLIVIGILPCMARDLSLRIAELPEEQLVKAQTLGASTWQLVLRVVLPQTLPRLIDSLRLNMGTAWLFLIAAEAIASTEGLGYRIFLVRRYLGHGCDPAVRCVDHVAGGDCTDIALRLTAQAGALSGRRPAADGHVFRCRMSGSSTAPMWCWRTCVWKWRTTNSSPSSALQAAARPLSCACCWAPSSPRRGSILIDDEPIRPEPDPARGIVFQRYSCSRISR